MHIFADDAERLRGGEGDVATDLRLHNSFGSEAEGRGVRIARLLLESLPTNGPAV